MARSGSVPLIGLVVLIMMRCNILMVSADVRDPCLTQWVQWVSNGQLGNPHTIGDEMVEWRENPTRPDCAAYSDQMCDYACRRDESAEVGRCTVNKETSVCHCCGFGLSQCSAEDGKWELNLNLVDKACEENNNEDIMNCDSDCQWHQSDLSTPLPTPGLIGKCIKEECHCCYLRY